MSKIQSVLFNPNSSVKNTSTTRILVLNPEDLAVRKYLYMQEAPTLANSEICALSENEFIVLERDGGFPGMLRFKTFRRGQRTLGDYW